MLCGEAPCAVGSWIRWRGGSLESDGLRAVGALVSAPNHRGPAKANVKALAADVFGAGFRGIEQNAIGSHIRGAIEHRIHDCCFFACRSFATHHADDFVGPANIGGRLKDFDRAVGLARRSTREFSDLQAVVVANRFAADENGGRYHFTPFNFNNLFTAGPDPQNPTAGTGDSIASMMLGLPASGNTGISISNVSRTWFHGWYLQDDWKATQKLTLNLGLRWEIQRPITDRYNRQAWFDYNVVNPISSAVGQNYLGELQFASSGKRGLFNTNYKNFAPRIGFAYQLLPKVVMRAGYGIFYPPSYRGLGPAPGFSSDTPYVASNDGGLTPANTLSTAFSGGLVPVVGSSLDGLTNVGFSINAVSRNRKTYYFEQWMY